MGNDRWALMHELRGAPEPSLDYLLDRMQHCDLVLIEGFKSGSFPKIEVWRASIADRPLFSESPDFLAVATDEGTSAFAHGNALGLVKLDLSDITTIADFVLLNAAIRHSNYH